MLDKPPHTREPFDQNNIRSSCTTRTLKRIRVIQKSRLTEDILRSVFHALPRETILRIVLTNEVIIDNTAGITDQLPFQVMERNRNTAFHQPSAAIAQTKGRDRLWGKTAGQEIRMRRIESL